jgi:glycosyltransferase involved in cell wall biosynthesis
MNNILYIQPYASQVGGVDTVLLELIDGLDRSKYKSYVVLPSYSPYVDKYVQLGAEVRYSRIAVFGKPTDWMYYFRNLKNLFISMRELKKIVKDENIQLIHSHKMELMGGNILGKLMGLPTVQTIHELPRKPLIAYQFIAFLNHLFNDHIIVLCERSQSMFRWGGKLSTKVRKIYNGIRMVELTDNQNPVQIKDELGLPDNCKLVVTVARLTPMKGIDYLLDAAKEMKDQHPDIKFVVVGDVTFDREQGYKEELLSRAHSLQLDDIVIFVGLRRDVPRILAQADAFLLPSYYDIFPTVILEAMNAGLPIIATDVGGIPEMVNENYGILIPPKDASAIKKAVLDLFKQDYKAMGLKARETVKTLFTHEEYVRRTTAVYEELLEHVRNEG